MDIKSLYTVIPNNGGLETLTYYLDQRTIKEPPTHTLTRLAELVLTLNAFSFNDQHYRQIGGVVMGTKMGPNYACLFVGSIEERVRAQFTGFVPQLHKRYIDDIVGAAVAPSWSSSLITSAIPIQLSSSHLPPVNFNCLSSTLSWQSPTTEYRRPYTTRRLTHTTICTTLHSTHVIANTQYHTASFYVSDGYVLMMSTFLKKLRRCRPFSNNGAILSRNCIMIFRVSQPSHVTRHCPQRVSMLPMLIEYL